MTAPVCPECGSEMELRKTKKFTTKSGQPKKFWSCSRFPQCQGAHGAHPDGTPLGRPGTKEEKAARRSAHAVFDALAHEKKWSKNDAYAWLAKELKMTREECHIANFGVDECAEVLRVCGAQKGA